jgi:hypothetical protein
MSSSANYLESQSCGDSGFVNRRSTHTIAATGIVLPFRPEISFSLPFVSLSEVDGGSRRQTMVGHGLCTSFTKLSLG